jgi:pimeloyl-ACP methyl ester carboxylesterase
MAGVLARGKITIIVGLSLIGLSLALWWFMLSSANRSNTPSSSSNRLSASVSPPATWRQRPCPEGAFDSHPTDLTCGEWHTSDGRFTLPVVILRYLQNDKQATPLLYLQGGPGAGAGIGDKRSLQRWRDWRDFSGLRRDLILVDRRGTGGSQPRQICEAYERFSREVLGRNLELQQEWREAQQVLDTCLAAAPGFNPADYGTLISAADIQQLGVALGIARWHVLGVSYGSRLALALASPFKAGGEARPAVASMVLDSVYPPGEGGLIDWPDTLSRALDGFYRACVDDADCVQAWREQGFSAAIDPSQLQAKLFASLALLRRAPMRVDVQVAGLPRRVVVNDHRLLAAVFAASYHRHRWSDVIRALGAVEQRERAPLARLMQLFVSQALSDSITSFTFMAVDCRDNRLGREQEFEAAVARHPLLAPFLKGMWQGQICQRWPQGAPLELPAPPARVALLAGKFDPITPVAWARELHRRWPASKLTEFGGIGHHVLGSKSCALAQLEEYLSGQRQRFEDCAEH